MTCRPKVANVWKRVGVCIMLVICVLLIGYHQSSSLFGKEDLSTTDDATKEVTRPEFLVNLLKKKKKSDKKKKKSGKKNNKKTTALPEEPEDLIPDLEADVANCSYFFNQSLSECQLDYCSENISSSNCSFLDAFLNDGESYIVGNLYFSESCSGNITINDVSLVCGNMTFEDPTLQVAVQVRAPLLSFSLMLHRVVFKVSQQSTQLLDFFICRTSRNSKRLRRPLQPLKYTHKMPRAQAGTKKKKKNLPPHFLFRK